MPPERDKMLSHYRLIEEIGQGGMGIVWKAGDVILDRTVAIKILPSDAARDERRRKMFLKEARIASSLSDAHIAQVHELGRDGDLDFIVMEYVEGSPLHHVLDGRPLPPERVAVLGEQVAQALSRAHRKGLLHRDLKPANIIVTPEGDAKVVDFGLAVLFDRSDSLLRTADPTLSAPAGQPSSSVVSGGPALAGTIPYMSPEQVRGEPLDPRSDIFSLGVVLYEMTTGQRPFTGAPADLLQEISRARARPPHELVPTLPLELDRIVRKAVGRQRSERYQTMEDLAVDLKQLARELESGSSPSYEDVQRTFARHRSNRVRGAVIAGAIGVMGMAVGLSRLEVMNRTVLDERTILILPVEVRGQVEGADYAGRAFAEALASALASANGLHVLPVPKTQSVDASTDGMTVARGRGAGCLLTGALTRRGETMEASITLLDVRQNRILWGGWERIRDNDLTTAALSLAGKVAGRLTRDAYTAKEGGSFLNRPHGSRNSE